MNRALLKSSCSAATAVLLTLTALPASADALHVFCGSRTSSTCVDNGTNSPTSVNPPPTFGFWDASGSTSTGNLQNATGTYLIEILTPNNSNSVTASSSFSISVADGGSANNTSFSQSTTAEGLWTGGKNFPNLQSFIGLGATPNNPFGAFTLTNGATGFNVFQADLGTNTLNGTGPLLTLGSSLPQYSYILAYLETTSGNVATANSGALYETGTPVPEPGALGLMGLAVAAASGLAMRRRTR